MTANQINDKGIKAISYALCTNNCLTSINLGNNRIGEEGANALGQVLLTNKSLTSMYLCNNGIDDDDAKVLAAGLCENKTLNLIDLSANGIGEEGAIALADMLRINNSLTFIDLNCNRLEDKGAETLVQALHVNHKILSIEFDYICLSGQHKNLWQETYELIQRNSFLRWEKQHPILLDMCIAMQPFDLPAYVLLWIYDQYGPGEAKINQFKKISLIESFKESVQRLKNQKHRKR